MWKTALFPSASCTLTIYTRIYSKSLYSAGPNGFCHVTFSWIPNETSYWEATCCFFDANRNAFLCDWCRFVQQISHYRQIISHAYITRSHTVAMEAASVSLLIYKTISTVMKTVTVYFAMSHMRIKLLLLSVHVFVLNQINLTDCFSSSSRQWEGQAKCYWRCSFSAKEGEGLLWLSYYTHGPYTHTGIALPSWVIVYTDIVYACQCSQTQSGIAALRSVQLSSILNGVIPSETLQ